MKKTISTIKEKCVGCNKCIMVCPVHYANNVIEVNGERKIEVNHQRCIGCGKCLQVCDHNARQYSDDAQRFFDDLKAGKQLSLIVAPSFVASKYDEYQHMFGYLKELGVNLIYDVSFGADITSWAHVKHIKDNNPQALISQPCPSIVGYIRKYATNLIPYLSPIQSPVACTAIYLKKYLQISDSIALLSPCIAKKVEAEENYASGLIEYNIPFERLCEHNKQNGIDVFNYPKVSFDNPDAGYGSRYSKPGGLGENITYHLPNAKVKQIEGPSKVYDYLNYLNKNVDKIDFELLDILNCEDGCNMGTATCRETSLEVSEETAKKEIIKTKRLHNQEKRIIDHDIYEKQWKEFDNELSVEDFYTHYTNQESQIVFSMPTEDELDKIFCQMHKPTLQSRKVNCYSCGYKTCKDMAIAIHNGYNQASGCYQYNKKELEEKQLSLKNYSKEKAQKEKYIRSILEHLSESVIVTSRKGVIEFANREAENVFGYSVEEYKNMHIQYLIPDINIDDILELKNESYTSESVIVNINDKQTILKIECNKLEYENDVLLIFIIKDITKEREVETLKSQFISIISHELRTPLTSIRGAIGLVASGALGELSDKSDSILKIANNNCIRLVGLVNDILDFEKLKAGKLSLYMVEQDLNPIVEESVKLNEGYALEYRVSLETMLGDEDVTVCVDRGRLVQILTNLISNACKFSPKEDAVNIIVENKENTVKITVQDFGKGIPADQHNKIFKTFSQVDSSDTREKGGTGLGLNISKALTEKMNGTIGFESDPQKGTKFFVELPKVCQTEQKIVKE